MSVHDNGVMGGKHERHIWLLGQIRHAVHCAHAQGTWGDVEACMGLLATASIVCM